MRQIEILSTVFAAIFLSGCGSSSPCSYDLSSNGWASTQLRPEQITTNENKDLAWFANSEGSILICPEFEADGVCGNYYFVFEKIGDSYAENELVCTT
jgi:hypothetical protein